MNGYMNTIHFTYACCISFSSFFSQNSSDNYESGVCTTKKKKKKKFKWAQVQMISMKKECKGR